MLPEPVTTEKRPKNQVFIVSLLLVVASHFINIT